MATLQPQQIKKNLGHVGQGNKNTVSNENHRHNTNVHTHVTTSECPSSMDFQPNAQSKNHVQTD